MNNSPAANDNEASGPPTDVSGEGPWFFASVEQIKRDFREFHRTNPFPEKFPGVARRVRPPLNRSIQFVAEFQVRVGERDGQKAACSTCLHADKFFHDGTLILDDMGWLYIVGPDCARAYYADGRFTIAERAHRHREESKQAAEFLWNNLQVVPAWVASAEALRAPMDEAMRAHAQLHASCPLFLTTLARHVQDRNLVVFEKLEVKSARGKPKLQPAARVIAPLRGSLVLSPVTGLAAKLETALQRLLPISRTSEDGRLELLAQAEAEDRLVAAQRLLRSGLQSVRQLRDELVQHRAFYSAANFETLRRWNLDPEGPGRFTIVAKGKRRTLYGDGDKMLSLDLTRLLSPLPALPL